MVEGDLEIAVPIFRALVLNLPAGVVGTWHEASVGMEVTDAREAIDIIDLEDERVCNDLSDTGDPDQSLYLRRWDEALAEFRLEAADVLREARCSAWRVTCKRASSGR